METSNCSIQLSTCSSTLVNLTSQITSLIENCTSVCSSIPSSECKSDLATDFNQGYHIGAIFVILVASALGSGIPVLSLHVPIFRVSPYLIILGKCMGIGVVLSCALIHMLLPGSESLTSSCVPWEFNTNYGAYAFLLAMIGGLLTQFLDYHMILYAMSRLEKNKKTCNGQEEEVPKGGQAGHSHEAMHGMIMDKSSLKSIEAYMLEFGVSIHSIFIGITIGISDDSRLNVLLPALVFHQFFEGIALGSRVYDAKFESHFKEVILISIFSFSAPIGMAIGVITRETSNLNGSTFLLVQGIFDSFCGGILLYIGYSLLLKDFPEDIELHCRGKKREHLRRYAMFVSLWIGAGVMAFIGKYL